MTQIRNKSLLIFHFQFIFWWHVICYYICGATYVKNKTSREKFDSLNNFETSLIKKTQMKHDDKKKIIMNILMDFVWQQSRPLTGVFVGINDYHDIWIQVLKQNTNINKKFLILSIWMSESGNTTGVRDLLIDLFYLNISCIYI